MLTPRETRARDALKRLGPRRFEAVVRLAASEGVGTGELLVVLLDNGESIERFFFDGEPYGHVLEIRVRGRRFHVRMGFMAPPELLAAEVGSWTIEFNDDDTIASVESMGVLIS